MGRLLVGALALGLATGLAIGIPHHSGARGAVLPRLEAAITKDARRRYHTRIVRTRCVRYQTSATHYSCTAVEYESPVSYTGKVYIAKVLPDGRYRFHPYGIPIWLGI